MPLCHKCGQSVIGDNLQCEDCKEGHRKELDYCDDDTFDPQDWVRGGLGKIGLRPKEINREDI